MHASRERESMVVNCEPIWWLAALGSFTTDQAAFYTVGGEKALRGGGGSHPPAPAVSFSSMDQYICQVLPERGRFHVCPVAAAGCDMKKLMFCQSPERKKVSMGLYILNGRVDAEGYIFGKYTCSFDLKGESWIVGVWFSFLFVKLWTSQSTFTLCMSSFQLSTAIRSFKAKLTLLILNGARLLRF